MLRNIKLNEAAQILSGYTFRKAISEGFNANFAVIQAKDVKPGTPISRTDDLTRILFFGKANAAIVQDGDVLLTSRGTDTGGFKATIVINPGSNLIAASSIYILRPNTKIIAPEYLVMYLNSEIGQEKLRRISAGSSIQTLLKKELNNLEIDLPQLLTQKTLARIDINIANQILLIDKHRELLQTILASTIKTSIKI